MLPYTPNRTIMWLIVCCALITGCSGSRSHYAGVQRSLLTGQPDKAIHIIQSAKSEYGQKSRLLYLMDHGMVLHLTGQYAKSNTVLEEAHVLVEESYTKRLRDEASTLLVNEARRPYEGAPHEQVLINVVKPSIMPYCNSGQRH